MAIAYVQDNPNYLGELYLIGANQTPFLTMAGGLNGGKTTTRMLFPVAQPWELSSASQDTQSESTAASAGTADTISRAQDTNTCQIMKLDVGVTFAKQSSIGEISGVAIAGQPQPVTDEFTFQKMGKLRQMAINIEYSFLQGTFLTPSAKTTNQTTRGICEACSTNTVAAGSVTLTKALLDELLRTMAGNGSIFMNPVIFVNAFQKQKLSDIYGYAPSDRNIGGVNIKQIETDFANLGVVYAPQMATSTLLVADMQFCSPVFMPYEGQMLYWQDTAISAAAKGGFWYTQVGLDYGPEEYHGTITGLATA